MVFILTLFAVQMMSIQNAQAYGNVPYINSTSFDKGLNEKSKTNYNFAFREDAHQHYSTHDWVADSALRLIEQNAQWRDYVKWILNYSSAVPTAGVPYNKLDEVPKGVLVSPYGYNQWYAASSYANARDDNGNGNYVYHHDADNVISEKGKAEWIKTRRYSLFLTGTMVPDQTKQINFQENDIEREQLTSQIKSQWVMYGPVNHYIHFTSVGGVIVPENPRAAFLAEQAGDQALNYLNKNFTAYEVINGVKTRVMVKGKYEAAAVCLGGMTHFIADVSSPPHTLKDPWPTHNVWDRYADIDLTTRFAVSTEFPHGGPNWGEVDPTDLFAGGAVAALKPMDPFYAAELMAYVTHTAYDTGDPDDAAENLVYDNPDDDRIRELLEWSVYYSACAMLGVLNQTDINKRDTTSNWLDFTMDNPTSSTLYTPRNIKEIQESHELDGNRKFIDQTNQMRMLYLLVPLFSLTSLPIFASLYHIYSEKDVEKTIKNYG